MTEAELYKELGVLTKSKEKWKESIPYVSSLITHDSVKIQARALWLLGEIGLIYPQFIRPEFVRLYLEQLRQISETDENRVVRIHCVGAIKATGVK